MSTEKSERTSKRRGLQYHHLLWIFLAIALFFLLAEHRAHLLGILPWLLLGFCILMFAWVVYVLRPDDDDKTTNTRK
ncbi:MAG: DUF2933 domain-containing protein [Gammaproteobacteria bacterium]